MAGGPGEQPLSFDLHTHHERCKHANGTIRDYVEAGLAKGLSVLGISDHAPYFGYTVKDNPYAGLTMAKTEFPAYIMEVLQLKQEYRGRIKVLLGAEADFLPNDIADYAEALRVYPLDYLLGSVHFVEGKTIFDRSVWREKSTKALRESINEYFRLTRMAVASGAFQIISHLDAMKTFCPEFNNLANGPLDETLKDLAEAGVAMEINTSGRHKECAACYPAEDVWERAYHYGVAVTFGSDAHDPSRVGDGFCDVERRLQAIGYRHWVYFEQRRTVQVPLAARPLWDRPRRTPFAPGEDLNQV